MVRMTADTSTFRRLESQLWPGFLLVALGAGALVWQRSAGTESAVGTAILMAVPVLLAVGVLLLLRATKLKEQQAEAKAGAGKQVSRPTAAQQRDTKARTKKRAG